MIKNRILKFIFLPLTVYILAAVLVKSFIVLYFLYIKECKYCENRFADIVSIEGMGITNLSKIDLGKVYLYYPEKIYDIYVEDNAAENKYIKLAGEKTYLNFHVSDMVYTDLVGDDPLASSNRIYAFIVGFPYEYMSNVEFLVRSQMVSLKDIWNVWTPLGIINTYVHLNDRENDELISLSNCDSSIIKVSYFESEGYMCYDELRTRVDGGFYFPGHEDFHLRITAIDMRNEINEPYDLLKDFRIEVK